ncbi:MAG: hypothetical protein Sylvanvirus24_13, partial [Sylvanvirus sp.]
RRHLINFMNINAFQMIGKQLIASNNLTT